MEYCSATYDRDRQGACCNGLQESNVADIKLAVLADSVFAGMSKVYRDPFSNGTEFEDWNERNCERCIKACKFMKKNERRAGIHQVQMLHSAGHIHKDGVQRAYITAHD